MFTVNTWFKSIQAVATTVLGFVLARTPSTFNIGSSLVLLSVLLIIIIICWVAPKRYTDPKIEPDIYPDQNSQDQAARKGLVILLSVFSYFDSKKFTQAQLTELIKNKDYKALELHDTKLTNFGHSIKAIKAHLSKLDHLWIITTKISDNKGTASKTYLPLFREYLENELFKVKKFEIHDQECYAVECKDDSLICKKTFEKLQDIYKELNKTEIKLKRKDIIVDVTGGLTAMKVGAILATLQKDQDIQLIGGKYDKMGKLIGGDSSYPIKIGYNPSLKSED